MSEDLLAVLIREHLGGASFTALADRYGLTKNAVAGKLWRAGVRVGRRSAPYAMPDTCSRDTDRRHLRLLHDLTHGKSVAAAAKRCGVRPDSATAIFAAIRDADMAESGENPVEIAAWYQKSPSEKVRE